MTGHLRDLRVLLPFGLLIAVWWGLKSGLDISDKLLVAPPKVWDAFLLLVTHGILAEYVSTSLSMIGIATLVSFVFGVPLGFAVGTNRYAARALEGFLRYLQGISGIAWLHVGKVSQAYPTFSNTCCPPLQSSYQWKPMPHAYLEASGSSKIIFARCTIRSRL